MDESGRTGESADCSRVGEAVISKGDNGGEGSRADNVGEGALRAGDGGRSSQRSAPLSREVSMNDEGSCQVEGGLPLAASAAERPGGGENASLGSYRRSALQGKLMSIGGGIGSCCT